MNKTILVAGGDLRQIYLAVELSKYYDVYICGIDRKMICENKLNILDGSISLDRRADYVVLPVPASNDGVNVNTPLYNKELPLSDIFNAVREGGTVFGGKISLSVEQRAASTKLKTVDYLEREELNVLNAVCTAEGAVQLAMEETSSTIFRQRVLITGFGRIARSLAKILTAMGAEVTVAARKHSDIAWAEIFGCRGISVSHMSEDMSGYGIVFNTVPAVIFDEELLKKIDGSCLVIDLASKPGGIDFDAASSLGIRTIWALSLPGKTAPVTSGRIIAKTILNILEERGEDYV